jgi:hypothetical protein
MSKTGQNNYKGINTQAFAALSLFLQNINRSDFKEMILEGIELEDFVLLYNSGKRIICESKYRSSGVGLYELKSIITTVLRNKQLRDNDELLIISNNFHEKVKSLVNNFIFWTSDALQEIKKAPLNFSDNQIAKIPQIKLWEVSDDVNREGILFLMYQVLGINNAFWLNKAVLEDWTNTLLVQDIYLKSESGKIISKVDFLDKLEMKKNLFLENNGTDLQEVKETNLQRIEYIVNLVSKNNPSERDVCSNSITELIANPSLHFEALRRLGQSTNLELSLWEVLWTASVKGVYSFQIFNIIKNNLTSSDNRKFTVKFINKILEEYLFNYHREENVKIDIIEVCETILKTDTENIHEIFNIVKKLFENTSEIFYYEERNRKHHNWEREKAAVLLKKLYQSNITEQALKEEIIEYIFCSFNLVEDEGKYWDFTPPAIFIIILDYIIEDPEERLLIFSKKASEQYQKFLRKFSKKIKFEGWEHMGGGISQSGSEFSIEDRQFVTNIFQPALELIPNNEEKWHYVNEYYIAKQIKEVSINKPDFLNRAVIPYLFQLYSGKDLHQEAYEILCDFIKMRKGIPRKADIIFQELYRGEYSLKQKWDLIQVSLDEYDNLPVNIFVEQIITEIALNDDSGEFQNKAIDIIISWSNDPKYLNNNIFGSDVIDIYFKLLGNPKTFDYGVSKLQIYLNSDDFKYSKDIYSSWDAAKALADIITKKPKRGIEILRSIESNQLLEINQQLVLFRSLDNLETKIKEILLEVYENFVEPLLKKYPNKKSLEKRFFNSSAREGLVKFAELLAKSQYYEQSLSILERLVEDTDPELEEQDDNFNDHNLHQKVIDGEDVLTITSVRGFVAVVLRYFCILPARDYFAKALPLLRKLCEDENYYIRVQATYPLMEFMKNRDTYIVNNDEKVRFVDEDTSNEVAEIAFSMLRDKENHKLPAVIRGLTHVFSYFRHMNQAQALEVMAVLLSSDSESVIRDATSLLVFFAEFRRKSFKKWPWGKLPEFDDEPFKQNIFRQIKSRNNIIRRHLSWEFWRLPKEGKKDSDYYNKDLFHTSIKYFEEFVKQEYEEDIWEYIYHFIDDYLEYEFDSCIQLWKACVLKERPYLTEAIRDKDQLHNLSWRPFSYNGKVLVAILKNSGVEEFLKWMEYLLDYPNELIIAIDIEIAVSELSGLSKSMKGTGIVFEKLVKRYPNYFDTRVKWLNQKT